MLIVEQIAHLQSEREDAIAKVKLLDAALKEAKRQQASAQNLPHQERISREHRQALFLRYQEQDKITDLNARIKRLNSRMRLESSKSNRRDSED